MIERIPPDCRWCGRPMRVLNWVETTRLCEAEPSYTAGRAVCETPDCLDRDGLKAEDRAWVREQMRVVDG